MIQCLRRENRWAWKERRGGYRSLATMWMEENPVEGGNGISSCPNQPVRGRCSSCCITTEKASGADAARALLLLQTALVRGPETS